MLIGILSLNKIPHICINNSYEIILFQINPKVGLPVYLALQLEVGLKGVKLSNCGERAK